MIDETILVVDDDAEVRAALAAFLEANGHSVAQAANGEEALGYLQHHEAPWLILLDLVMPVMGGVEFMEKTQSLSGVTSIPVVVLTASRDPWTPLRDSPPASVLRKPIEPQILLDRVNQFHEHASSR